MLLEETVFMSYTEYASTQLLDSVGPLTIPSPLSIKEAVIANRTSWTLVQSLETMQQKLCKSVLKSTHTGCSLQSLPHTVSSQHYSQSPVCWRFRWEAVLSQHPSRRQKSSQRTAKLKDILKSQSRFLMSFSSFRMRLDSGSGEVTWERLVDMDMGAPEALPMTADTGILARYISISMLCSARRKPCECKEKVKVEVSAQDQNYPWKMTFSYYHQENIKLQVILV